MPLPSPLQKKYILFIAPRVVLLDVQANTSPPKYRNENTKTSNHVTKSCHRARPPLPASPTGRRRPGWCPKKWPRAMDRSPGCNEASKRATVSLGRDKGAVKREQFVSYGRRVGTCDQIQ